MCYRFIADYTTYPADYAEVSTFSKPPSECNSGSRSPAPYATTTLVGNARLINYKNNNHNMYFTSDLYHPQMATATAAGTANRCVYSESYYNPKEKINITENRLGSNTFNPSLSMPHTPFGTVRKNRFKLLRNPQFRISFGDGKGDGIGGTATEIGVNGPDDRQLSSSIDHQSQHMDQGEQLYVKVGETNIPSEYNNWTSSSHSIQMLNGLNGGIPLSQQQQAMAKVHSQSLSSTSSLSQHQQQPSQHSHTPNHSGSIYQNHHHHQYHHHHHRPTTTTTDKDMIYAPSGNRSVISYMSANNRFDDV